MKARQAWLNWALVGIVTGSLIWALTHRAPEHETATNTVVRPRPYPGVDASTATLTPLPSPTPNPDADGYLPAPDFVSTQVLTIASSPYAEFLRTLQSALTDHDSTYVASLAWDLGPPVSLAELGATEVAFQGLTAREIKLLLDRFYETGSRLIIQGYFAEPDPPGSGGGYCLNLVLHGFRGAVPRPTTEPDYTYGMELPDVIPIDAAMWRICYNGDGLYEWKEWSYGQYYGRLNSSILARMVDMEYPTPYYVLRP